MKVPGLAEAVLLEGRPGRVRAAREPAMGVCRRRPSTAAGESCDPAVRPAARQLRDDAREARDRDTRRARTACRGGGTQCVPYFPAARSRNMPQMIGAASGPTLFISPYCDFFSP